MGCKCCRALQLRQATLRNTNWLNFKNREMNAKVVDVYDVDTVTIAFHLSGMRYLIRCRLLGIDGAEMKPRLSSEKRSEEIACAIAGKKRMEDLCLNKCVRVVCSGWDKYGGRILGTLYLDDVNVNELMVTEGFAYKYKGDKKLHFTEWHI